MDNAPQSQKDDQSKGASCNATIATPFLIFIGLAAIIGAVIYFVLK